MNVRSKIKNNARRAVTQNYIRALSVTVILICICLLFAVITLTANIVLEICSDWMPELPETLTVFGSWNYLLSPIVVAVSLLFELILLSPLSVGTARWFFRLTGGSPGDILDVFDYFGSAKSYFGTLWLEINLFFRRFFYSLLFLMIPAAILAFGFVLISGTLYTVSPVTSVLGSMLIISGIVLSLVTGVLLWVFLKRYFLARYLYVEDGSARTARQAIKQSLYMMKGRKGEMFLFDLSFIPWFLLCVLILPIFYVGPYYLSASSLYARVIIETVQRKNETEAGELNPTREFGPDGGTEAEPEIS